MIVPGWARLWSRPREKSMTLIMPLYLARCKHREMLIDIDAQWCGRCFEEASEPDKDVGGWMAIERAGTIIAEITDGVLTATVISPVPERTEVKEEVEHGG